MDSYGSGKARLGPYGPLYSLYVTPNRPLVLFPKAPYFPSATLNTKGSVAASLISMP